jgi:C4-type Zn-finger protein
MTGERQTGKTAGPATAQPLCPLCGRELRRQVLEDPFFGEPIKRVYHRCDGDDGCGYQRRETYPWGKMCLKNQ